jgi:hypothetical protein
MLVAILLALQAFVVQTHIHPASTLSVSAPASAHARPAAPADAQAPCPLCEELALAGHVLPPVPIALVHAAAVTFLFSPRAATADAPRTISHRWRSRAPPITPQA